MEAAIAELCDENGGICAMIGKGDRAVGIRGDIDALPVEEETGFNRLGTDDLDELRAILSTPHLNVEGIYSHLALKDRPSDEIQLKKFLNIVETPSATAISRTASAQWMIPISGWI